MTNHMYGDEDSESAGSFVSDSVSNYDNDADSSLDGGSTTNDSNNKSSTDEVKFAKTETQFVLCSKFMAYLVLFLSAVAAGFTAYYLTREQENLDFERDVSVALYFWNQA